MHLPRVRGGCLFGDDDMPADSQIFPAFAGVFLMRDDNGPDTIDLPRNTGVFLC